MFNCTCTFSFDHFNWYSEKEFSSYYDLAFLICWLPWSMHSMYFHSVYQSKVGNQQSKIEASTSGESMLPQENFDFQSS